MPNALKFKNGVFPKYEIAVISRVKSAVHKDIKVKNDEVRAKREPSLLQSVVAVVTSKYA